MAVLATEAKRVTEEMFIVAAKAVAEQVTQDARHRPDLSAAKQHPRRLAARRGPTGAVHLRSESRPRAANGGYRGARPIVRLSADISRLVCAKTRGERRYRRGAAVLNGPRGDAPRNSSLWPYRFARRLLLFGVGSTGPPAQFILRRRDAVRRRLAFRYTARRGRSRSRSARWGRRPR